MKLVVLSDTHGLLRQAVLDRIGEPDAIIHAGDVGDAEILEKLAAIAPTWAVRGNTDWGPFGQSLPPTEILALEGGNIYVLHDIATLDLDPSAADIRMVVYGHSHTPEYREEGGVRYLNPGSIGPRRFHLPITFATVQWSPPAFEHEFVTIHES